LRKLGLRFCLIEGKRALQFRQIHMTICAAVFVAWGCRSSEGRRGNSGPFLIEQLLGKGAHPGRITGCDPQTDADNTATTTPPAGAVVVLGDRAFLEAPEHRIQAEVQDAHRQLHGQTAGWPLRPPAS
jgi:hypothetical protein